MLAFGIFAATILVVLIRPRGLNEALACGAGALLVVVTGTVSLAAAFHAITAQWNVLLFFVGLLLTTWSAEQAGVVRWAALRAATLARGSKHRLFFNIAFAGAGLTALLSNDATALLLTAVVIEIAAELQINPLPLALLCAFIANSASTALPVSNPLNILVLGTGGASLGPYLVHLLPATIVVLVLTVGLCWLRFRRDLDGGFDAGAVPPAGSAIKDPRLFRFTSLVLGALAAVYVAAAALDWPLSIPVAVAGGALWLVSIVRRTASVTAIASAPWSIVPFVAGLLVLVQGLESTGFTHSLGDSLLRLSAHGTAAEVFGATAVSAAGANLLNNLPSGAVMVSALRTAHAGSHPGLLYGTLLGSDVGPNLTVFGALSSMLWLMLCRRRGIAVTAWEFARWGLLLTPVLLVAGATQVALAG